MKLRKWMSALLAVCMTVSMATTAIAAGETEPGTGGTTGDPSVEIVSTLIGTKYIEVGLEVAGTSVKSVGTVLQYNAAKVKPITWATDLPQKIVVPAVANELSWTKFEMVPAKGGDMVAAKPAMTFAIDANADGTADDTELHFIYLGADSFKGIDNPGRVVTVRFEMITPPVPPAVVGTAEIGKTGTWISPFKADPENNVAVTRMQRDDVQVHLADGTIYTNKVLTSQNASISEIENKDTMWRTPAIGSSVGASESGGLAVTFLDWDGSLMDTTTLPNQNDVTTELDGLRSGSLKDKLTKAGYIFDQWLDYDTLVAEAAQGKDVPFTSSVNGIVTDSTAEGYIEAHAAYVVDTKNILSYDKEETKDNGIVLQAAYKANDEGPDADYAGKVDYTFGVPYYTRYGSASESVGKYSVTLTMNRGKAMRARMPGLRVTMQPKLKNADGTVSSAIYSYQATESTDAMTFEMVPTRDMTQLTFQLVDNYGFTSWIDAGTRGGSIDNSTILMNDVIKIGTANFIMEQAILVASGAAEDKTDWQFVNFQAFADAMGSNVVTSDKVDTVKGKLKTHFETITEVLDYQAFSDLVTNFASTI